MRNILILTLMTFLFSGCEKDINIPDDTRHTSTICPKFTPTLKIKIEDLNGTHGSISWIDVTKIEIFLNSKKKFNDNISIFNHKK